MNRQNGKSARDAAVRRKASARIVAWVLLAALALAGCQSREQKTLDAVTPLPGFLLPENEVSEPVTLPPQNPPKSGEGLVKPEPAEEPSAEEPSEAEPPAEPEKPEEPVEEEPEEEPPPSTIDVDSLRDILEEELDSCTGEWALYWKCLNTGDSISLNSERMVAASLIKLFVAGAYYQAVQDGTMEPRTDLVKPMITESSNEACNKLIDLLGDGRAADGMAAVNRFAASIGCKDTELNRKMLEQVPVENYTSVADCAQVLEMVYDGLFVNAEASEELMGYLKQQTRTGKIPAGVPEGIQTANKTGELAVVENDVAIVWAPGRTYILCVMSNNILSPAAGQSNIVILSQKTYDFLDKTS